MGENLKNQLILTEIVIKKTETESRAKIRKPTRLKKSPEKKAEYISRCFQTQLFKSRKRYFVILAPKGIIRKITCRRQYLQRLGFFLRF